MRRTSREINIFNMSLLDILCGALGAFCFMMLGLFPYYKPIVETGPVIDPKTFEQAKAELAAARQKLQQIASAFNRLQSQNQQLANENRRLQQQQGQAQGQLQEAQKKVKQLETREPVAVQMWWSGANYDVDLWITDNIKQPNGQPSPQFDPLKKPQAFWPGDRRTEDKGPFGSEVFLMRDMPPAEYHIYYNIADPGNETKPAAVDGIVLVTGGKAVAIPRVLLNRAQKSCDVGVLRVAQDRSMTFLPSPELTRRQKEFEEFGAKQKNGGA